MRPTRIVAAIFAGTAMLIAAPAFADPEDPSSPVQTTMGVSLTVVDQCLMAVDAPLAFPDHGIFDEDVDATTTLTVQCTKRSPFTIGFDKGGVGSSVSTRQMLSGTDKVNYQLFRDELRTENWGNTKGTDTLTVDSADGADQTITVYGRVPTGQNVPAGDYADTVTATIWYGADWP